MERKGDYCRVLHEQLPTCVLACLRVYVCVGWRGGIRSMRKRVTDSSTNHL